jgi:hypothetical protein
VDIDDSFDKRNETVSLPPTPDLESSATPIQCISCSSTEGNASIEKPTLAPTSVRLPPRVMKKIGPIVVRAGSPHK